MPPSGRPVDPPSAAGASTASAPSVVPSKPDAPSKADVPKAATTAAARAATAPTPADISLPPVAAATTSLGKRRIQPVAAPSAHSTVSAVPAENRTTEPAPQRRRIQPVAAPGAQQSTDSTATPAAAVVINTAELRTTEPALQRRRLTPQPTSSAALQTELQQQTLQQQAAVPKDASRGVDGAPLGGVVDGDMDRARTSEGMLHAVEVRGGGVVGAAQRTARKAAAGEVPQGSEGSMSLGSSDGEASGASDDDEDDDEEEQVQSGDEARGGGAGGDDQQLAEDVPAAKRSARAQAPSLASAAAMAGAAAADSDDDL